MNTNNSHRADRLAARLGIEYKWIVAVVFVLGLFIDIMDTTIVNVAIPTLANEFNVTGTGIEWLVLGYLLSLAVWIPASGWIGDRYGAKRTFLFALLVFTGASVLCGTADTLGQMIAFRILQGVGGGMLTPVGTAMLFRAFPRKSEHAHRRCLSCRLSSLRHFGRSSEVCSSTTPLGVGSST